MNSPTMLNRRDFMKVAGTAGAGLIIGFYLPSLQRFNPEGPSLDEPFSPNAWLRIDRTGTVTVTVAKSEMGQGVVTALPMILAEELDVDWSSVRFEQAEPDKKYGSMGTGGSASVRTAWQTLRNAGATARAMLITAAARMWGVDPSTCTTSTGTVRHAQSGRSISYGDLVPKASDVVLTDKVPLKDPKEFRIIGTKTRRLDSPLKVDGSAKFGIDVRVPGMMYATVVRCPVFGGKATSVDAGKAQAIPGVKKVVTIDTGVAVIADSTWAAFQGRDALSVVWDEGRDAGVTSESIAQTLSQAALGSGAVAVEIGDALGVLVRAKNKIEAVYEAPFLAHATMEPMNCTADVRTNSCELWVPTQSPQEAQKTAAELLGIDAAKVRVHTTFLGGGFGRRSETDFVTDAVLCSKAVGAPVKMTWTREEDMQHDKYRPVSRHHLTGAIGTNGSLEVLTHKVVAPSIGDSRRPGSLKDGLDRGAVEGTVDLPYAIANLRVEYVLARTPVPIGAWRSVYPSQNVFALECFIDELAESAGKDPYQFRLALTAQSPRAQQVLRLAAEKAGWERPLPKGRYRGLACAPPAFFRSFVAHVVEISVSPQHTVRVHRVVSAVDCGVAVNPDTIEAQIEGGIVYGLSAALKGEITIDKGRVRQSNFDDYPVLTMDEMPEIEVHIVPSSEPPTGTGEPGLPPIAPAVANAVYAATGRRVRRLPIRLQA